VLHTVLLAPSNRVPVGTNTLRICPNIHLHGLVEGVSCGEYSVDSLFMELGKRETHSHNTRLPFIEIGDASP
jgi:hypothetical protein